MYFDRPSVLLLYVVKQVYNQSLYNSSYNEYVIPFRTVQLPGIEKKLPNQPNINKGKIVPNTAEMPIAKV